MSEKITFRELIESIAEETDNSKQFTHDFIKDFVDVINGGLEDDGSVNIAGFGKFQLRQMDEREGYNPQTEEKITIPAHNKVVFKPYKDLRELVNAPYTHLEPELIEEDTDDNQKQTTEDTDAKEQDEFIPMAPPTSHEVMEESDEDDLEIDFEDPFGFDTKKDQDWSSAISDQEVTGEEGSEEISDESTNDTDEAPFDFADDISEEESPAPEHDEEPDEDSDVVEFNAGAEEETSHDITDFISPIEPSEPKEGTKPIDEEPSESFAEETKDGADDETSSEDEVQETEENRSAHDFEDDIKAESESEADSEEEPEEEISIDELEEEEDTGETAPAPSFESQRHSRKQSSKAPMFVAAAVILLLVAAGAWYFSNSSNNDTPQMAASETSSTVDATASQKKDQLQQTASDDKQNSSNAAKQSQNKQQSNPQKASASATTEQIQVADNADLEIKEGQTLWSIAEDRYGNPRLWPWIYGNNGSLKDPDLILAGSSLSVPLPSGPQNALNAADSMGVAKGFVSTYRWYKDNESMKARNHLWAATSYYDDIRDITDIEIDKADLVYANEAR